MAGMAEVNKVAAKIIVKGMVQMVGFRYFVRVNAQQLGVNGWVRNVPNGDVEVVASANTDVMEEFIGMLKRGPSSAMVKDVLVNYDYPVDDTVSGFSVEF
jgi:acylphosphatase